MIQGSLHTLDIVNEEERKYEVKLRPRNFTEVIGREKEIGALNIMIQAARQRKESLDHLIFFGPPGLGKTSVAMVIANEMSAPIHITSGPAIEKAGDLAAMLTSLEAGSILFIDEIHRLSHQIEEILYPAMEDRVIDIVLGKGPSAKSIRIDLSPFTLIGATTRVDKLSPPLRERFGASFHFDYYLEKDLAAIVIQKAKILSLNISSEASYEIARRARKTPRIAIRILKRVRDYAQLENAGDIGLDEVKKTLDIMEVDSLGLDIFDRKLLGLIYDTFSGGPVGLSTLAAALGEEAQIIEDITEPYLMRLGLIQRTPKGRIISQKGIEHFLKSI